MMRGVRTAVPPGGDDENSAMVTCPQGHANPADWTSCGECGRPLGRPSGPRGWFTDARLWAVFAGAMVVIVGVGVLVGYLLLRPDGSTDETDDRRAVLQAWWITARPDVEDLRTALRDSQRAIQSWDSSGFDDACRRIHDAAAVGVPEHLPAPDAHISAELSAAAEDAHSASHMCLAVIAQSHNDYDGEFSAAVEQADQHLETARALVDLGITA